MREFVELTVNGLLIAGLYATVSMGLALIYGVMKIINLAHAGFLMLGAFATFSLFGATGLDPLLCSAAAAPLFFVAGMLLYHFVVRPLPQGGNAPTVQSLLLLFGVWLVLQNLAYAIWGGETRSIMTSYTLSSTELFGLRLSVPNLLVFGAGAAALSALQVLLSQTRLGMSIRAVTQNRDAALLCGINATSVARIVFGLGTALAAFAGGLLSVLYPFTPDSGRGFLLKAFCIVVLGGMESLGGVVAGALVLALLEQYAVWLGVPTTFQEAVSFGVLVLVLIIMPQGLPGALDAVRKRLAHP
ncbi:MAG: branched-chain amino acid ABC transporter permease [Acidobacteriota bacterium]